MGSVFMSVVAGAVLFPFLFETHCNIQPVGQTLVNETSIYIVGIWISVFTPQLEFFGNISAPFLVELDTDSLFLPVFKVSVPAHGKAGSPEKSRYQDRKDEQGGHP